MDGTREKLIAIIEEARREAVGTVGSMNNGFAVWYADKLLAAGVAPVVRCKVCKYATTSHHRGLLCTCQSGMGGTFVCEDDYCSQGRKQG